ncbi:DsrE family protein [Halomicrobium urmianum]|uniref:DsrE family protein n=1 Tax=Halomicrobium urmianum TaxID=1586233 RepID=UPI001CD9F32D|nr:DsrE family protein [Halomicrobium urmianum]
MLRRNFVAAAGTISALLFGSESVGAAGNRRDDQGEQHGAQDARPTPPAKTVLHLSGGEKSAYQGALMNAKNLLDDDSVPVKDLILVANGPGVKVYTPPSEGDNEFADLINSLQERGVTFRACENAMDMFDLTEDDLLDGVETVPSAVGELARLQELDYGYIKAP